MGGTKYDEGKPKARLFYYEGFHYLHQLKFFHEYDELHKELVVGRSKEGKMLKLRFLEQAIYSDMIHDKWAPQNIFHGVCSVSELGANKYGVFNYTEGMKWSRVLDALGRHMIEFVVGKTLDDESGLDHRFHMLANIYMLSFYIQTDSGEDDLRGVQNEADK